LKLETQGKLVSLTNTNFSPDAHRAGRPDEFSVKAAGSAARGPSRGSARAGLGLRWGCGDGLKEFQDIFLVLMSTEFMVAVVTSRELGLVTVRFSPSG
jgi:hypothetical protein